LLLLFIYYGDTLFECGLKPDEWMNGNISMEDILGIDPCGKEQTKIVLTYWAPYCAPAYASVHSYKRHKNRG
jgi:hypothetical protein